MYNQYLNPDDQNRNALSERLRGGDLTVSNKELQTAWAIDAHFPAADIPLDRLDPSHPALFANDTLWDHFARLRKEDPVHYHEHSLVGPYWSVTRYEDIMTVDKHHELFSSQQRLGGITLGGIAREDDDAFALPMFIQEDPPKHDKQRKVVTPMFIPRNLAELEPLIRQRAGQILDDLPINEEFNWVKHVSVEARKKAPPKFDLISMLAHDESTKDMSPQELLGNIILLIVGGNDTTRNSISGGVLALNKYPDQYEKLLQNPGLIPKMVPEIIRWQTPLAHMARTALADTELGGKHIKKGDRLAMWYISGNRDESYIDRADEFIIDRPNPRNHTAFGYGIHRCVGNRLAEMQLNVMWEEINKRFSKIEVTGDPLLLTSSFVHGIRELPVTIRG